jgi:hypothetical protein
MLHKPVAVIAVQVNVTIDDTDPSFVFSNVSTSGWIPSTSASGCTFCLAPSDPNVAYKGTWHHGLHIVPQSDTDDNPVEAAAPPDTDGDGGPGGTDDDGDADVTRNSGGGKGKGSGKRARSSRFADRRAGRRRDITTVETFYAEATTQAPAAMETGSPFFTDKFDADDPQFVDTAVFVQFNFTGPFPFSLTTHTF